MGRMGRPQTLTPAPGGGAKLYAFLMERYGSTSVGAREAGLPEQTVRRYCFNPPKRPQLHVVTALEGIGAERCWLDGTYRAEPEPTQQAG